MSDNLDRASIYWKLFDRDGQLIKTTNDPDDAVMHLIRGDGTATMHNRSEDVRS